MLKFPEFSRDLHRGEEGAVDELLASVYGGEGEAQIVHALRRSGSIAGEVVLPHKGAIVGYYALSQMRAPAGVVCLGPLAIDPDWQRAGHGRRMIGLLAEWARISGKHVVAQGCQPFFVRAGFRAGPVEGVSQAGPEWDQSADKLIFPAAFGKT